jgi:hypothetical protein
MPNNYSTFTPDGERLIHFSVEWTAPGFKDIGITTPAQLMAWVRQKLDELGFDRKPWSVERQADGTAGIEVEAYRAMFAIPEFKAYAGRRAAEIKEHRLKTTLARLTQFDVVLPELEASIADLFAGQDLVSNYAGDTILSTHIASLSEACQALVEGVQQLKHITLTEKAAREEPPNYSHAYVRLCDCLEGLEAALERDLMQAYKDGTWQKDREIRDACRDAFQKLEDTRRACVDRHRTLDNVPSSWP